MMRKPPPNAYLNVTIIVTRYYYPANVLQDFLGITMSLKFIFCKKLFISNKNWEKSKLKKKKKTCVKKLLEFIKNETSKMCCV